MHTTLITPEQLHALQQAGTPVVVCDVSFSLDQPALGAQQFADTHIAGAIYVHLDDHLSSHNPATAASGGRHPLPSREEFAQTLQQLGVRNGVQVVVYDRNGCNYCGRLWWMLQWLGHEAVAILDGGLQAWQQAGLPTASGASSYSATSGPFMVQAPLVQLVSRATVQADLGSPRRTLVDSRGAPRYRGEVEPLDPVAGHIPGALNRLFSDNLADNGRFKSADTLRQEFTALLGQTSGDNITVYCGSGVSAVPNFVALRLAGFDNIGLYAGSWSDWCTAQPALPVERG